VEILISGASGFIGSELVTQLEADGHTVKKLVRSRPSAPNEFHWSPETRVVDASVVDGVDAVINLSGASTGHLPWTRDYKKEILDSRVDSTETLAKVMAVVKDPPRVFLNGSAVGIYGDRPSEHLTEESPKGSGFLADVVEKWEAAAELAPAGVRVVMLRTGVVVGKGGAFTPLLPLTRAGLGSRFGTGGQNWPWISLHDEAAAIRHLLTSTLHGPVNLVGPTPATSDHITRYLAERLGRPYFLKVPEIALRTLLRDAGQDLLLTSESVSADLLLADGFTFTHQSVEEAIDAAF
jgi:uncharacterized protein (TIGR01777 family)